MIFLKAKKRAKKAGAKAAFKVLAFTLTPTALFILFAALLIGAASAQLQRSAAVFSMDESLQIEESFDKKNIGVGKATYVGVDDTDTAFSKAVLRNALRYSNKNNPYFSGYAGLCELWVSDIYKGASLSYNGACCAHTHGKLYAKKSGKIPKGAAVFSGIKPDGKLYENGRRQSAYCYVCKNYAGHVGIYIGNGFISGSQVPFLYTVDSWIATFGYGGWSKN